jgi:hypothetical protein
MSSGRTLAGIAIVATRPSQTFRVQDAFSKLGSADM